MPHILNFAHCAAYGLQHMSNSVTAQTWMSPPPKLQQLTLNFLATFFSRHPSKQRPSFSPHCPRNGPLTAIQYFIIIIIIIILLTMFMVLPSWHSHCESSSGSFDECRLSAGWPPTLRPNQPIWVVSPPERLAATIHRHLWWCMDFCTHRCLTFVTTINESCSNYVNWCT